MLVRYSAAWDKQNKRFAVSIFNCASSPNSVAGCSRISTVRSLLRNFNREVHQTNDHLSRRLQSRAQSLAVSAVSGCRVSGPAVGTSCMGTYIVPKRMGTYIEFHLAAVVVVI